MSPNNNESGQEFKDESTHGIGASNLVRNIEKFDGTDFQEYKEQLECVLKVNRLWEYIEGSKAESDKGRDHDAAMAVILMTLDKPIRARIRGTKKASDVWAKLKKHYESRSTGNVMSILRNFHAFQMDESDDMVTHLTKFHTMVHQLETLGEQLSQRMQASALLHSVQRKYEMLVITIESQLDSIQVKDENNEETIDIIGYISTRLTDEEKRQKEFLEASGTGEKAFLKKNFKGRKSGSFQSHKKQQKGPSGSSPAQPNDVCHKCGYKGHWARDCYSKTKKGEHQKRSEIANKARTTNETKEAEKDELVFMAVENQNSSSTNKAHIMYIDSGATAHMTSDPRAIFNLKRVKANVFMGDGTPLEIKGRGELKIITNVKGKRQELTLTNVALVPELQNTLISVTKLMEHDLKIEFSKKECLIYRQNQVIASGVRENNLLRLNGSIKTHNDEQEKMQFTKSDETSIETWHRRLGHLGYESIKELKNKSMVIGLEELKIPTERSMCEGCLSGRQTRKTFQKERSGQEAVGEELEVLEDIHSDVVGPISPSTPGGKRFYVTFIDGKSTFTVTIPMAKKSEVTQHFKEFKAEMENQTGKKIKRLRTDNGGEYTTHALQQFLKENGIKHITTPPHSPQNNGLAERTGRTITEKARTMIHSRNLPKSRWGEAVVTATYLKNRSPSKSLP